MKKKWQIWINIVGYLYIINAIMPYIRISLLSAHSGHIDLIPNNIYAFFIARFWRNLFLFLVPIIIGIGILQRREIVRKFVLYLSLLTLVIGIVMLLSPVGVLAKKIFGIIWGGFFVWLFSHLNVKEQFK